MTKAWQVARGGLPLGEIGRIVEATPCCLDTGFPRKIYDAFACEDNLSSMFQMISRKATVEGFRASCSQDGGLCNNSPEGEFDMIRWLGQRLSKRLLVTTHRN